MPPKKKNNNKKADDWEAELGETPEQAAVAAPETKDESAEADPEDEFPAGGLMAMMRKKQKKNKKGKPTENFVEGEDAQTEDTPDLAEKAPVDASIDDDFALPEKKGKGKNEPAKATPTKNDNVDDEEERGADGKVLTKAQKEKLKKEREKLRKKENVCCIYRVIILDFTNYIYPHRLQRRKPLPLLPRSKLRNQSPQPRKNLHLRNLSLEERERSCHLPLPNSKHNKKS